MLNLVAFGQTVGETMRPNKFGNRWAGSHRHTPWDGVACLTPEKYALRPNPTCYHGSRSNVARVRTEIGLKKTGPFAFCLSMSLGTDTDRSARDDFLLVIHSSLTMGLFRIVSETNGDFG